MGTQGVPAAVTVSSLTGRFEKRKKGPAALEWLCMELGQEGHSCGSMLSSLTSSE